VIELPWSSPEAGYFAGNATYFMQLWHRAATVQTQRIRQALAARADDPDDQEGTPQELFEFCFLAVALGNLERALTRYAEVTTAEIGSGAGSRSRRRTAAAAERAAHRLPALLPDVRPIRDVVSHLDEYVFGLGRIQRDRKPAWIEPERGGEQLVITTSGDSYRLDLLQAERALDAVALDLIAAWAE
jgi:hypothetical protein